MPGRDRSLTVPREGLPSLLPGDLCFAPWRDSYVQEEECGRWVLPLRTVGEDEQREFCRENEIFGLTFPDG